MKLYPHQLQAVSWLSDRDNACLADEQGLGKTAVAIVAAGKVCARRILVVCPAVVTYNWQREFAMWAPGRKSQVIHTGTERVNLDVSVVIVSHALSTKPKLFAQLTSEPWDLVICDESHAMKTPLAKRTKAFYTLGAQINAPSISRSAQRVWLLTGTPMPNDPTELWTMLRGLAPERIHAPGSQRPLSWFEFRSRYCTTRPIPGVRNAVKVTGTRNVPELRSKLQGFMLRRMKADHLDLPPIRWGSMLLTSEERMSPELRSLNLRFRRRGGDESDDAYLDRLRQDVEFSTWRRLCGEFKAPIAAQLIHDELRETTEKRIVFAHHVSVLDTLQAELQPLGVVRISGDVAPMERQRAVDAFQADPSVRVALCNIVAGGVGITLTASSDVDFVEQSFVPGEMAQAACRAHRIGQTRPVAVRVLTLANSVDASCGEILARKASMIQEVLK